MKRMSKKQRDDFYGAHFASQVDESMVAICCNDRDWPGGDTLLYDATRKRTYLGVQLKDDRFANVKPVSNARALSWYAHVLKTAGDWNTETGKFAEFLNDADHAPKITATRLFAFPDLPFLKPEQPQFARAFS